MAASRPIGRTWYDPMGWPELIRWLALIPLPLCAAIVAFLIYSIVNGIFPDMPTAVTGLFAAAFASSAYVALTRVLAPSFDHLIGLAQVGAVSLFAAYMIANAVTNSSQTSTPTWYTVLFGVAAIGGAVYGASVAIHDTDMPRRREVYAWMPGALRWLLFIPVALCLSFLSASAFGLLFYALHVSEDAAKLVNTLVMSAVFVGVSSAVVPRGKSVVGIVFAVILCVFAALEILSAIFRPTAAHLMAGYFHRDISDVGFTMPVWYQLLSGVGLLTGAALAAIGSTQAEGRRGAPVRDAETS